MMRRTQPLEDAERIEISLDGKPLDARGGEPVAVSLLAAGVRVFARSIKYHRPRAPFCLGRGGCEGCLMRVDGVPNVMTCAVEARAGMRLERQNAFPTAELDVMQALDWIFPRGMDHHGLVTRPALANRLMLSVARRASGLGTLPDAPAAPSEEPERIDVDVAVVGGGVAGRAAAHAAARAGARTLLIADDGRAEPAGPAPALRVLAGTVAFGYYDGRRLMCAGADRAFDVRPARTVLATGAYEQSVLFGENDLPGILSARGARRLARWGIALGEKVVVASGRADLVEAVANAGTRVVAEGNLDLVRARGRSWIRSIEIRSGAKTKRIDCDALVTDAPPAPAYELCEQAGCEVRFEPERGGFVPLADGVGRTTAAHVLVAGAVRGPCTEAEARDAGARAGQAAAEAG